MTRKEKTARRQIKQEQYLEKLKKNIKDDPGSHSDFIEKLMNKYPADRGLILAAERIVFREMRG